MDIFVRGVGVGLTHTENLIIKKLKSARETGELETEGENAKKPPFGRIFESYFDLPNHYSNNIVITDSDFILTERTCAIAITAAHVRSAQICNIRPNITQRRSVEKVPIDDWQASVTLTPLVFHRLDLAS